MVHDEESKPVHVTVSDLIPKKLFHVGYWDGPLTGLCEYEGETYFFNTEDDVWMCDTCHMNEDKHDDCEDCYWERQYVMHQISPSLITHLTRRHKIFRFLVYTRLRYRGGMFIWYNFFSPPKRKEIKINCPIAKFTEFERNDKIIC